MASPRRCLFFFFFWSRCTACGILVPQPGIELMPPAMEAWSPNHWTTKEFPGRHLNPAFKICKWGRADVPLEFLFLRLYHLEEWKRRDFIIYLLQIIARKYFLGLALPYHPLPFFWSLSSSPPGRLQEVSHRNSQISMLIATSCHH